MPSKPDNLEYDIISLLQKHEPKMLRWSEIVRSLWDTNQFKYKDKKGFGVAVTSKLNLLVAGNKIKKEEIYYGSISSVLETQSSNTKGSWNPAPKIEFSVTQQRGSSIVHLPTVAFNLINWSPYQLSIRLQVWTFLGGRNLGLIQDSKGYYSGKIPILAEPDGSGFGNGCFTVPSECVDSKEELSLSIVATFLDRNDSKKNAYQIIGSYTHRRTLNDWFYEPTNFVENEYISTPENWHFLLSDFSKAGANLIDVKVEKHQSGTKSVIQGVLVLRGAKKLQDAIKMHVPDEYDAFLFTEASLDKYDMLTWQGINFIVREIEDIYDVYSFSYRIAKLVKQPPPVEPAFVLF
jgi:hypothetical protein